jgi:hypothetical protein
MSSRCSAGRRNGVGKNRIPSIAIVVRVGRKTRTAGAPPSSHARPAGVLPPPGTWRRTAAAVCGAIPGVRDAQSTLSVALGDSGPLTRTAHVSRGRPRAANRRAADNRRLNLYYHGAGSFILIDMISDHTVAVGMIIESVARVIKRLPEKKRTILSTLECPLWRIKSWQPVIECRRNREPKWKSRFKIWHSDLCQSLPKGRDFMAAQGVRIGAHRAMPRYTNTAKSRGYAGGGSSEQNCAICTAAGAVNLCRGYSLLSTGKVAEQLHTSDSKLGMGTSVDNQVARIAEFVESKTGRHFQIAGSMDAGVPYAEAAVRMQAYPDGTVFALCVSGMLVGGTERKCHWLNALKAGGSVRYFDFQSNRTFRSGAPTGGRNPATSTVPIIGVVSQLTTGVSNSKMHSADQPGAFATGTVDCVIIAFPKS